MGHIQGLTNLGIDKDSKYMEPWISEIGRYMINFGMIELLSYKFLNTLEATEDEFLKNTRKLLSKRIQRIEKLLEESNLEQKQHMLDLWAKAKILSVWRNRIAHNPVLLIWRVGNNSENSPPDFLGISDMKQITNESKTTDTISLDGLSVLNNETVKLVELLNEICGTF